MAIEKFHNNGFCTLLNALCKDKEIGERVVPIVPDEARTFGMEGMFRQLGSIPPLDNYTIQLILIRSCFIVKIRKDRCWRRVSPSLGHSRHGLQQRLPAA